MLGKTFDMKDLGEASFVLGIEIIRDGKRNLLGLSQKSFVEKVFRRFNMHNCLNGEVPKLNNNQCPKNNLEKQSMQHKPYASLVGSLMYIQVCTILDFAFSINICIP